MFKKSFTYLIVFIILIGSKFQRNDAASSILNILNNLISNVQTQALNQVPMLKDYNLKCSSTLCNTCTAIKVPVISVNDFACATIGYNGKNLSISLKYNAKTIYNNTTPITQGIQSVCQTYSTFVGMSTSCFSFNTTATSNNKINACGSVALKIGTQAAAKNLGCVLLF